MAQIVWDTIGQRFYETGVDHGVLYLPNSGGDYDAGYAWNGLVSVTESPTGAEPTATYADNIKYLNLLSIEEFGCTIEAYTYPDEFAQCDGSAELEPGVHIGQQTRKLFGLSYRTKIGTDLDSEHGYKLHLVWNALAAPSEKAYNTINETPEPVTFSWEVTTTPIAVNGAKPTASMTIDSRKVDPTALATLESILYGSVGVDPRLPTPDEVRAIFANAVTEVTPLAPFYVPETETVQLPTVTGVVYRVNGVVKTGDVVITGPTLVTATPAIGYKFPDVVDDDWVYNLTTLATPSAPTYDPGTDIITIPSVTGVVYKIDGNIVAAGPFGPITEDTVVTAVPEAGYAFPTTAQDVWEFTFA